MPGCLTDAEVALRAIAELRALEATLVAERAELARVTHLYEQAHHEAQLYLADLEMVMGILRALGQRTPALATLHDQLIEDLLR